MQYSILAIVIYIVLAPLIGGLLTGLDDLIISKLQGKSSSVLTPLKDVFQNIKLEKTDKKTAACYISFAILNIVAGCIFYGGGNIVLAILLSTFSGIMLVLTYQDYKEILRLCFYFTHLMLAAIGFYLLVVFSKEGLGSFNSADIVTLGGAPAYYLPGILVSIAVILIFLPRNESNIALLELGRWYELFLIYGILFLFNFAGTVLTAVIAVIVCILVYLLRLFIAKYILKPIYLSSIGLLTLFLAFINIIVILK